MFQLFTSHHQTEELKDYYKRVTYEMTYLITGSHTALHGLFS
jgi:hypothetical protein